MSRTANNLHEQIALQDTHSLLSAFEQFSRLSEQLQHSYEDLDRRAGELTRELAQANSERLEQLAQKEKLADRLEKLLTALPAGVVVLNRDGIIHTANRAAREVFEQDLIGVDWLPFIQAQVRSSEASDLILHNGRVVTLNRQHLDSDDEEIVLIHDVSHNRMLQELAGRQQRLAAMGQMAAGLGHQLRTPLSSALLYVSQVLTPALNDEQQMRAVEKIRASLRYLEKLINDMLMYAKGGEFASASFNVSQLLINFNARFEARLQQADARLSINCECDSDMALRGSIDALVSVLINLAENALEACTSQCQLQLRVYQQAQHLILALSDNGPGLSAEQQLHIFEPFYTDKDRGTGLGLAVAQSIAHAHQGDLLVKSEPGHGSTFYLCLPLETGEQFLPSGQMTHPINNVGQNSGDTQ
jgi:two-component system sensor histidine kinase FlrB